MHYMDTNKIHREKARWKLHKNATCCFEQILEATLDKTAVVRPTTSHLTNHPSKTNNTYRHCYKRKDKAIFSYRLLHMDTPMLAD